MTRLDRVRNAVLANYTLGQKLIISAIAIGAPTLLRALLGTTANPTPFVTYFPAALLTAVIIGWRWAAAVTLTGAVIANRLFLAKQWLAEPSWSEVSVLIFFALSCTVLIATGSELRHSIRELDALARKNDLLSREMHHRVQNVFSVMAAMVRMTDTGSDAASFRANLSQRIQALSKANRILQESAPAGRNLRDLIRQAISPFGNAEAFVLEGRDETVAAQSAHGLVLILNELCTNAIKHGALSVPQGRVTISWSIEQGALRIEWKEQGGPPVLQPARKGFGTRLLRAQHSFDVELLLERGGARCILLQNIGAPAKEARFVAA